MAGLSAHKLWSTYICREYLLSIFHDKLKNRSSIGIDWISSENFESSIDENVDIILKKCNTSTYKFTRYRELLLSKGALSPPRCVSLPTMRDKLVLSAVNKIIADVYGSSTVSPMPQVLVSEIKQALENGKYDSYIKLDISSFYASIDHCMILRKLKRKIRKKEIIYLIETAIKTSTVSVGGITEAANREKGIPEGLSISNALANLFLHDLDKKYSFEQDKFMYWRYVDDILILACSDGVCELQSKLITDLRKLDLEYNIDKSLLGEIKNGFEYLGYYFLPCLISVRKRSVIGIERAIDAIFRNYHTSENKNCEYLTWKVNLKITGFIIDNYKYGWLFFYSQINDLRVVAHLDWLVTRLSQRYKINPDIRFKKFMRSYNEISRALHTTSYIPNLDTFTIDEKRSIVQNVYGENVKNRNDDVVNGRFRRLMNREIRDIQKDVQPFS